MEKQQKTAPCKHCNKKMPVNQTNDFTKELRLCDECKLISICYICGVLMDPETTYYKNLPSKIETGRCVGCEKYEDHVKSECAGCGNKISKNFDQHKTRGNMCVVCIGEISREPIF